MCDFLNGGLLSRWRARGVRLMRVILLACCSVHSEDSRYVYKGEWGFRRSE